MPFKPGDPRPPGAGRKKGSVSAKTLMLEKIFELNSYNPAEELLKLLPKLDEKDQARVHLELMQYQYPKRREQPEENNEIDVYSLEDKKKLLSQSQKEIEELKDEISSLEKTSSGTDI